jgi:hypothetical protein
LYDSPHGKIRYKEGILISEWNGMECNGMEWNGMEWKENFYV